jgi:hypothetical protein
MGRVEIPPESKAGFHGEIRVENDDQVMLVYAVDQAAYEKVAQASRDASALVQEWMIPHDPTRQER